MEVARRIHGYVAPTSRDRHCGARSERVVGGVQSGKLTEPYLAVNGGRNARALAARWLEGIAAARAMSPENVGSLDELEAAVG